MKRIHYAWVICFVGLLMFICNMGLCSNALTIYLPFIEAGGISHSAGSSILSVRCTFSFLTTFIVGAYYKRFSLRTGATLATLFAACAPLIFMQGGSNPFIYYIGAAIAGIGYGFGCMFPVALLINNWFHDRRGLAMGISSAGSGVATMVFSPLISSLVLNYSLKTAFLVQFIFLVVCAAVLFLLIRDFPSQKGLAPLGSAAGTAAKAKGREEASPPLSPALLAVSAVMMLLTGGAAIAFSGHLAVLARTCGYSAETVASMMSVFGMMLIISKMSAGMIADRIGSRRSSVILILIFVAGCFIVFGMNGVDAIWCYILVVTLATGAAVYNVGPPLWAADLSSQEHYPRTLKWLQIFYNLGGIIFPPIPGLIAEQTGEYKSSFLLFSTMMSIVLFMLLWLYRAREAELRNSVRT